MHLDFAISASRSLPHSSLSLRMSPWSPSAWPGIDALVQPAGCRTLRMCRHAISMNWLQLKWPSRRKNWRPNRKRQPHRRHPCYPYPSVTQFSFLRRRSLRRGMKSISPDWTRIPMEPRQQWLHHPFRKLCPTNNSQPGATGRSDMALKRACVRPDRR
jgi:hypothetical protein